MGGLGTTRPLHWRHNGRNSVSNHQPHDCLLNRLFRRSSKKTSQLHVTGLCVGNSPGTGEFPAQMASNAENVSIWWRAIPFFCRSAIFPWWSCIYLCIKANTALEMAKTYYEKWWPGTTRTLNYGPHIYDLCPWIGALLHFLRVTHFQKATNCSALSHKSSQSAAIRDWVQICNCCI